MLYDIKTEDNNTNPYREQVVYFVCAEAFGTKHLYQRGSLFQPWYDGCSHVCEGIPESSRHSTIAPTGSARGHGGTRTKSVGYS